MSGVPGSLPKHWTNSLNMINKPKPLPSASHVAQSKIQPRITKPQSQTHQKAKTSLLRSSCKSTTKSPSRFSEGSKRSFDIYMSAKQKNIQKVEDERWRMEQIQLNTEKTKEVTLTDTTLGVHIVDNGVTEEVKNSILTEGGTEQPCKLARRGKLPKEKTTHLPNRNRVYYWG